MNVYPSFWTSYCKVRRNKLVYHILNEESITKALRSQTLVAFEEQSKFKNCSEKSFDLAELGGIKIAEIAIVVKYRGAAEKCISRTDSSRVTSRSLRTPIKLGHASNK